MAEFSHNSAAKRAPAHAAAPTPSTPAASGRHSRIAPFAGVPQRLFRGLPAVIGAVRFAALWIAWDEIYQRADTRAWALSAKQVATAARVSEGVAAEVLTLCVRAGLFREHEGRGAHGRKRYSVVLPLNHDQQDAVLDAFIGALNESGEKQTARYSPGEDLNEHLSGSRYSPGEEHSLEKAQSQNWASDVSRESAPPPPMGRASASAPDRAPASKDSPYVKDLKRERCDKKFTLKYSLNLDAALRAHFERRVEEIDGELRALEQVEP